MSTFISRYMIYVGIFSAYSSHCRSLSLPGSVLNGDLPTAFGRKRPRDDGTYITYIHCICIHVHVAAFCNFMRRKYLSKRWYGFP